MSSHRIPPFHYPQSEYKAYYRQFESCASVFDYDSNTHPVECIEAIQRKKKEFNHQTFYELTPLLLTSPQVLEYIPSHIKSNGQEMLLLFSLFHRKYLQTLAGEHDKSVCRNIWEQILACIQWLDESLNNNPDFIHALIKKTYDCRLIAYTGDKVRNHRKLIVRHVLNHPTGGQMISLAGEKLMKKKSFIYAFLNKHAEASFHLPHYMIDDTDFLLKTMVDFPVLFEAIDESLRTRLDFIVKAGKIFPADKVENYFIPYVGDDTLIGVMMAEFDMTGYISQTLSKLELKLKLDNELDSDLLNLSTNGHNDLNHPSKI
jgi:hypothetical protein